MQNAKELFANRLRDAMQAAGYEPKPAVLEREFNTRYWGKPMTLHGVRRWLRGETLPTHEKLLVLAEWLGVPPQACIGIEDAQAGIDAINASGMRSVGIGAGLTRAQLLLPSTESLTWPRLSAFWQNV